MNENLDKKLIDNLIKLGLSEKESLVYLYLIGRESEVGTSKIITGTGLHGQYVYNALEALQVKGLVKHVVKNGRRKWSSTPPNRIDSLVEEKRIVANQIKDSLLTLYTKRDAQEFEVFQGEEQFVANEFAMIAEAPMGGTIDVIGGEGDRFANLLGDVRRDYNRAGLAKEMRVRIIGTEKQKEYLQTVKNSRDFFDYKIFPGFNGSNVSTAIHTDAILFQVYGNPVLVFKIKSKEIASNYRTFFDSLWNVIS